MKRIKHMKHKLSYRLAVTYGLIFIFAVAIVDIALAYVYRTSQLKKNENYYMNLCSILSSMAENSIKITNYIATGEGLADQKNGRVLLVDTTGRVLLDSGDELAGTHMTNPEFRKTVQYGEPAVGYYTHDNKGMAMFSYPVSISGRVNAVVLVSVYIQDIYDDINRFALVITAISIIVIIIVVAVSVIVGRRLSDPITRLTGAVNEIYKGNMETAVEVKRNDEIGVLAGAFNKMGSELKRIETGRKRFISDVSHELKTPLASIKALIEALIAGDMDSNNEYREYLQDINHEIDRMNNLVISLLAATRLEEMALKKEPLILQEEVEHTIKALKPLAAQKRITLQNNCEKDVIIHADRYMLQEVIINLVDNSIKYGVDNGRGYVKIGCSKSSFWVEDNGCGIPPEDIDSIFDCFYRIDKSRSGESGNGIGLYIVKRIIELHGFKISVSSEPGKGSIFTVEFHDQDLAG
jgi:two-component system OmpR family sensor kinase